MRNDRTGPENKANRDSDRIVRQIRALIDLGELCIELYEDCVRIAKSVLSELNDTKSHAESVALDFLIWIKDQHGAGVNSLTGLRKQFRRFWTRKNSPAVYELWTILSEALRELARDEHARRLDKPYDEPNCNSARWTSASAERDMEPLDLAAFEETCASLPTYPRSRKTEGPYGKSARILSPSEAQELTLLLLKAASGPIFMSDLVREARKHVLLPVFVEPPDSSTLGIDATAGTPAQDWEGADDEDRLNYADLERIEAESLSRSERIWGLILRAELCQVFCGYFLPKHSGAKVRLEDFGTFQRVGEKAAKIEAILEQQLLGFQFEKEILASATKEERFRLELRVRILARLIEMCGSMNE